MVTAIVKHATLTGAAANSRVLVDGPKWDASHTVEGLESVVAGPPSSATGNIALYSDATGKNISSAPTFQSGNPGNAGLYTQVANPPNGTTVTNNLMQVSLGTPIPAGQQFGYGLAASPTQQAIAGTASIAAGDTTTIQAAGVAGYAITYSPTGGAGAVAVGLYGQGAVGVANGSTAAGNTVVTNNDGGAPLGVPNPGFDANFIAGFETDINIVKKAGGIEPTITNLFGFGAAGGGNSTTNQGDAFQANMLSVVTGAKWSNGFRSMPGAAVNAFAAGPLNTGATSPSQPIILQWTNGAATTFSDVKIQAGSDGNLLLRAASGAITAVQDGTSGANIFLAKAGAFGNTGVQLSALAAAGVVTNDASGSLTSSPTLPAARFPVLTGDITTAGGALATTLAAVIVAGGPTGSATVSPVITYDAKGRLTAVSTATITPAIGSITGLGTGIGAALAINAGSAGAPVLFNGALGTPSSGSIATTLLTGALQAAQEPAHTGDVTNTAGSLALAIGATKVTSAMLNADVYSTAHNWAGQQTLVAPILGTPASGVATNLTGTASGLTAGNVTTNANLTGSVVTSAGNATSITSNSITNAMRAAMATNTIKGNNTGSTANESDLSIPNIQAMLGAAQIFIYGTVNFNAGNTDTSLPVVLPTGATRYAVSAVRISGASASLTTATAGVFTAAAGGGTAVVTGGSAITVSTAADNTNNNAQALGVNNTATQIYTVAGQPTLFFRVANPQGSAATATVAIQITPLL